ncbi:cytochrome P450 oxidoreductase [Lindgomyces ingoldianus]|uniref:Cytochrome P450 oxidoreductase n=1 Tax=Lindgomyces ingoldianus TaxID=673940 RepID=A0ACB6QQT7_9PLEO|nr:cytochrome P450 oxidoreductase [Lindgomyces ingoldianus]KAF2469384.1 cytochrome P450 oxidoreductase [Lindgomyces ingoldianus]
MVLSTALRPLIGIPLFLLVVCIKLVYSVGVSKSWNNPLSKIPGPAVARLTRLWLVQSLVTGKAVEDFRRLDREYGSVVRVGPKSLLISDPDVARKILSVGSRYTRGPFFDALRLEPTRTNVISERDPKKHQLLRSILGAGIAVKGNPKLEVMMDEHIRHWIKMIDSNYISHGDKTINFDLSRSIPFLNIDFMSHLCLGKSFGCLEYDTDMFKFLHSIRTGMIAQQCMSILSEITTFLHWLAGNSSLRKFMTVFPAVCHDEGIGRVMRVIHSAVTQREADRRNKIFRDDMLDSLFDRGLTADQALTELSVLLATNTDNGSSAVQAIIFAIITNPRVYMRLQDEIDSLVARGEVSFPISNALARKLPYLQACISEGLRCYPPEMQLRERMAPPEGDFIGGYNIPGGTYVGFNAIALQHNKIYGEDTEVYRPERWFDKDEERRKQMQRTLDLMFSHGSSKCLGLDIAYMEMNKLVVELFRHFDVAVANPSKPWKRLGRGSFYQWEFFVRVERRTNFNAKNLRG